MAALYFISIDGLALAAATAKTALEIGPAATDAVRIKEWWVDFDGVTSSAVPVKVEVGRFSATVTTATTLAGAKLINTADGAASAVARHSTTVEGAGTPVDVITRRVSPTSGFHYIAPLGQEFFVAPSTFFRIRLTAAAIVNASFGCVWED